MAAGIPGAARAKIAAKRFAYKGADVRIGTEGSRAAITVDGQEFELVASNGAYRAAGFMYSPQPTAEALARRLVENRRRIGRGV